MGTRYRKSIGIGKIFRINLSRSGVGYSVGTKGARVSRTANGRTRTTISAPGTGLSHVTETSSRRPASKKSGCLPPAAAVLFGAVLGLFLLLFLVLAVNRASAKKATEAKAAAQVHVQAADPSVTADPISTEAPAPTEKVSPTVYVSSTGKIHNKPDCSGMTSYTEMTLNDALNAGYDKCQRCY